MKLLVITPLKHLDGVYESLESMENITDLYYEPDVTKDELKKLLIETNADYLFTNPNKQNFILDGDILKGSSVIGINTASTGLNHIDLDY